MGEKAVKGKLKGKGQFFTSLKSKKALTYKAFGVAGAEGLEPSARGFGVALVEI